MKGVLVGGATMIYTFFCNSILETEEGIVFVSIIDIGSTPKIATQSSQSSQSGNSVHCRHL